MAKLKGRSGPNTPLDEYKIDDSWWQQGQLELGRPFVGGGSHRATSVPVVIKQWQRRASVDDDVLREIWRDEIRQLNRLKGLPRAGSYLATLRDSFEDDLAFTLVLDCGDRVPLAHHVKYSSNRGWHSSPRTINGRIRLWQETRRIAEAVGILHSQGLLHRNIDPWAIMTSANSEPDFLLTGFEWSMRVSGRTPDRKHFGTSIHSFYEDWRALGNVIAWLLKIPPISKPKEPYKADAAANTDFLTAPERDLLRTLIIADPMERLDSEVVIERLNSILSMLQEQKHGGEAKLVLVIALDAQQAISRSIRDASEQTIELSDYEAQRRFVADSLSESPRLVRLKSRAGDTPGYRLSSSRITFDLRPFSVSRGGETTWSLAMGSRILSDKPAQAEIDAEQSLDEWEIEVIDLNEARKRAPRSQGKATRWIDLFEVKSLSATLTALERTGYSALMLAQISDILWRAAQIWPIRKIALEPDRNGTKLTVEGREDPKLSLLSKALGLKPSSARLIEGIRNETIPPDGEWQLSTDLALGRVRNRTSTWRFSELVESDGRTYFVFESSSTNTGLEFERDFYIQVDGAGYDALVERRLTALRSLRDHTELLDMLRDPAGDIRLSRDDTAALSEIESDLDDSKIAALRNAWQQLPLYLVQGPPGVGKTRLVRALVAGRLGHSPMDRLLLSAQSHSTVDHLLDEVKLAVDAMPSAKSAQIFPLRCRSLEADAKTEWDREHQAKRISANLAASDLAKASSPSIRKKIIALRSLYGTSSDTEDDTPDGDYEPNRRTDRSFESLLLRSANLVFASTNSPDIARLLGEGGQFDWSIVEEAGRATGVELLAALMLSHRRLMIGDHQQLPAFDTARLTELLSNPSRLREGFEVGRDIIAPLFRKLELEDSLDWFADNIDERLCAEAVQMLTLFETLIVPNVIDKASKAPLRSIGSQLLIQHRMHPVIGNLISDTFYKGKITTSPEAEMRFLSETPPLYSANPDMLPDEPIVFIDIPYVQTAVGMKVPEKRPSWSNKMEAEKCIEVLSMLRATTGARPSLAILSPYRRQVQLLRHTVESASPRLSNLDDFRASAEGGFYGTVDSFQGNEADIVVVSLVRNNSRTGYAALGFLSEEQRMNVLLSRAKWRLVVIGSLDFLRACLPANGSLPAGDPLSFLDRLLHLATRGASISDGGIKIIPFTASQRPKE